MRYWKLHVLEGLLGIFIVLLVIGICLSLRHSKKDSLLLKTNTITLYQGEYFDPLQYVESYTGNGELQLPTIDSHMLGEQVAIYRYVGNKTIERILLVNVVQKKEE